ncbi:MAG: hypothetical protein JWM25_409 [Thermoleophilia bacterium]|nr:hypothetical protein [Thermoleophilia bacterium]
MSEVARDWATELGVTPEVLQRLVDERRALVDEVAVDPGAWGFDLRVPVAERFDLATEFRRRTRLPGKLAESFIDNHAPLLDLVPNPLQLPDGTTLPEALTGSGGLTMEAAMGVSRQIRHGVQAHLGRPLDRATVARAVREAAWEYDFDASIVERAVLDVLAPVL